MTDTEIRSLTDEELKQELRRAEGIDRFMRSDTWYLLSEGLQRSMSTAKTALESVDPTDVKRICALQQRISIIKSFLADAIEFTVMKESILEEITRRAKEVLSSGKGRAIAKALFKETISKEI